MSDYYFERLNLSATKEYKFQQRKSAPEGSQGECFAVCVLWIKEKITAHRIRLGSSKFSASPIDIHTHNLRIMTQARSLGGHGRPDQLVTIEEAAGLQADNGPAAAPKPLFRGQHSLHLSLLNLRGTLERGCAACVLFRLRAGGADAGHAVALYRSRANTLHFFDPNCGIYTVPEQNFGRFTRDWLSGCEARGWSNIEPDIGPGQSQTAWCRLYPRGRG